MRFFIQGARAEFTIVNIGLVSDWYIELGMQANVNPIAFR